MFAETPDRRRSATTDYDAARALRRLRRATPGAPVVIGQLGQSLDGRIALPCGASKYINGRDALRHLHRLRARVDAVVIGVGTAVADDPALTTRHVPGPTPLRVVIDPQGRMPRDRQLLSDGAGPVAVVTRPGSAVPPGVERIVLAPEPDGSIAPGAIVSALTRMGVGRILVEGGAATLARFIDAGAVDELHLMIAPVVLGSGKTGLNLAPIGTLDAAMRPPLSTMRFPDGDMLCLCDLAATRVGREAPAEAGLARRGA